MNAQKSGRLVLSLIKIPAATDVVKMATEGGAHVHRIKTPLVAQPIQSLMPAVGKERRSAPGVMILVMKARSTHLSSLNRGGRVWGNKPIFFAHIMNARPISRSKGIISVGASLLIIIRSCGKLVISIMRFIANNLFSQHLRGVHIKPYQCPRCYTRYGRSNERDRHVKGKTCYPHENIKNYVVEFGEKILNSTEDGLYEILYVNGKKQYDLLDQTDGMRKLICI